MENANEAMRLHKKVLDYLRNLYPESQVKFEEDSDSQVIIVTLPFEMGDREARDLEKTLNRLKDRDQMEISVDPDLYSTSVLIPVFEVWADIAW